MCQADAYPREMIASQAQDLLTDDYLWTLTAPVSSDFESHRWQGVMVKTQAEDSLPNTADVRHSSSLKLQTTIYTSFTHSLHIAHYSRSWTHLCLYP